MSDEAIEFVARIVVLAAISILTTVANILFSGQGSRVVRYPLWYQPAGPLCIGLGIGVIYYHWADLDPLFWAGIGIAVLGVVTAAELFRVRHLVEEHTISYRGIFNSYPEVPWKEIRKAEWKGSTKYLALTITNGLTMHISAYCIGLDTLATALVMRCPNLKMDAATTHVVNVMRAGAFHPGDFGE